MTPSALILTRLGAKSWTELYERTVGGPREGDLLQALIAEGGVSEVWLRGKAIEEQGRREPVGNRREFCRRIAERTGLSERTVRRHVYGR